MQIHKLHANFGAVITGADHLTDISQADIETLRAALAEYQLLLFRFDRHVSPERQVEISSWFGPPVSNSGGQAWSVLHNKDPAGAERLAFHSDFTYTDSPFKAICLHAIEVPPGGTSTAFVSGVHGWATLPENMQTLLHNMTARHVQDTSITASDLPIFTADHPVRYEHPRLGKPVLLVTEYHARRINELSPEKSAEMLRMLFQHLYRPENIYVHDWKLYDMVLWDNLAVQHSRRERAGPDKGARALQRVAINDVGFLELIERARQKQEMNGAAGFSRRITEQQEL